MHVRVLVRPSSSPRYSMRCLLSGSNEWRETCAMLLRSGARLQGFETVYHVAADYRLWARDPGEIYESNLAGTKNLLDAARVAGR